MSEPPKAKGPIRVLLEDVLQELQECGKCDTTNGNWRYNQFRAIHQAGVDGNISQVYYLLNAYIEKDDHIPTSELWCKLFSALYEALCDISCVQQHKDIIRQNINKYKENLVGVLGRYLTVSPKTAAMFV